MKTYVPTFQETLDETIKKTGRKTWTIYSEKGRRLGTAGSMPAAKRRLRQIEYFKRLNENDGEQYVIAAENGQGYLSVDFTTKQPQFTRDMQTAYKYSMEEAEQVRDILKDTYNQSVEIVPCAESAVVPTFEDYTNDEFRMSDWYFGSAGGAYASDGRAMRDFDDVAPENEPSQEDAEKMRPFIDLVRGISGAIDNVTEPHKGKDTIAFGFSSPQIADGPYAGADSWWTFMYDCSTQVFYLINDVTGQEYMVADANELRKLLDEVIPDLREETA
jgi:hypothetical protein